MDESVKIFPWFPIIFKAKSTLLSEIYKTVDVEYQHLAPACLPDLIPGDSPLGHQALAIQVFVSFSDMPCPTAGLGHMSFPLLKNLFLLTLCRPSSIFPFRSQLNGHFLGDVLHDFPRKAPLMAIDNHHVSFRALAPISVTH